MSDQDGAVLLDLDGGRYYSLNAVGSLIWQKLAQGVGLSEIESALVGEFGAPPETAAADVARFVTTLAQRKLVVQR